MAEKVDPVISVRAVSYRYEGDTPPAIDHVSLTINPGERVEYNGMVSTRDLIAGRAYVVEVFFPNYDKLRIQQTIVPQK